jgi:hypothetical protein
MPTVRAITRDSAKNDYRFVDIVLGIVESDAFQLKAAEEPPSATEIVAGNH